MSSRRKVRDGAASRADKATALNTKRTPAGRAATKPVTASRVRSAASLLLFASGAAALVYQILWVKQLSLIVGVDVYAVTIGVSAFFAGLALGGFALGEQWFGISRGYRITPLQGGTLDIPSIAIVLHPGQTEGPVTVRTTPLKLSVKSEKRPPGAENAIASTRLRLTQSFDRKLEGLKTGDAFTRTANIVADGTQAMFLPPIEFPAVNGLAVYPKAPKVTNITKERQGFVAGQRVDAATYVVQRAGDYELPAIVIRWWDISAGKLRSAKIPAVHFTAAPNAAYKPEFGLPAESVSACARESKIGWKRVALWCFVLAILAIGSWLVPPFIRRKWHSLVVRRTERRRRYETSESAAYAALTEALRGGEPARIVPRLYRWLDKLSLSKPSRLDQAAIASHDAAFAQASATLVDRCYGEARASGAVGALLGSLPAARKQLMSLDAKPAGEERHLAALNPN